MLIVSTVHPERRAHKNSAAETNFFYFNSSSPLARKRRSGSGGEGERLFAFSYKARACKSGYDGLIVGYDEEDEISGQPGGRPF